MAQLIAEGVCRFVIHGTYGGHEIANMVDMKIDTTGSVEDRATACRSQGGIIRNEWQDTIIENVSNQYSNTGVSWIDLDSQSGSTGEVEGGPGHNFPAPGGQTGQCFPGHVALRVNKTTVARRGERQGRLYVVGLSENLSLAEQPNTVDQSWLTTLNTAFESFLGDINQNDVSGVGYGSDMVVVHTKAGVFVNATAVTSLQCDKFLASQVRRIRR